MTTVEVHLPDEIATNARRAAQESGVSFEELIVQSLQEKLARDKEFGEVARFVLEKNRDLYERLS